MPSSSDPREPIVTKFGTGVQFNKVYQRQKFFWGGPKIRGVKIDFSKKKILIISGRIMPKYTNLGSKKFWFKKIRNFSKFLTTILAPPATCNVTGLYKTV